ncbi:MAG TPA: ABC transporter permease [Bacteroidia bacterium]|nr:ABC transporter permease [Bacteroidia bacterium]HRS58438.1 ABC transporter permease [Bacteroidia bacterium]HRU68428.1 ABC transporter permease [Bacteroidia bacterium]
MKTKLIVIAWRNLWRNKRRTLITMASIVFSVFFASVMRSLQEGSYDKMIDNLVKFYTGYVQVQDSGYWNEKTLDNTIEEDTSLSRLTEKLPDVLLVTPRIEGYGLAASKDKSKPVLVLGIDPEKEDKIIKLSRKIIKGSAVNDSDEAVMIAEGLAGYLDLQTGDTLVIISQGYHGVSAAGKFPVKAIFRHPSPEFNNRMIFCNLKTAQAFFYLGNKVTSQVVMVKDHYKVAHIKHFIEKHIPETLRVMTWDEMQPEMDSMIKGDRAGGIVMLLVLYLVIGFGIFGTAMMMINERKKEFGVVNSIGMTKTEINLVLLIETFLLGIIGVIAGLIITIPVIWYFYLNPVPLTGDMAKAMIEYGLEPFYFVSVKSSIFLNQGGIILILCFIVSCFSMISVGRMKMIDALRS